MSVTESLSRSTAGAPCYDLSVAYHRNMPIAPLHPPYTMTLNRRHGDLAMPGGLSLATEVIFMCGHTGTHIDALGHWSRDNCCHGGVDARANQLGGRLRKLDVASIEPIVTRGVLLDIAALKGVAVLPGDYAVTADDLAAAERRQGVLVQAGDAVLVHTGWNAYYDDTARFRGDDAGTPGPDASAALWLAEHKARVTGDETISYEVVAKGENARPVHAALLVDAGIPIIEMMNLAALARDKVYQFLFVCSPLRLVGATASPVRPIAIPSA